MSLLNTLGSLALNEATKYVAKEATKKVLATKEKQIIPPSNDWGIMTGGGQTSVSGIQPKAPVKDNSKELEVEKLFDSRKINTKEYNLRINKIKKENTIVPTSSEEIKQLADTTSMETKVAQDYGAQFGTNMPTPEKVVDMDALGNVRLSVTKAKQQIADFANPNSTLAKSFITNLGDKKYEFANIVKESKRIAEARSTIEGSENVWAQTLTDMGDVLNDNFIAQGATKILDYLGGTNVGKTNKYAKEFNLQTGKETASPIAEGITGFAVEAPIYMAMGLASGPAALAKLSSFGLNVVKGQKGVEIARIASKLEDISIAHPTLYAATVDNALSTALDYTGRKVAGMEPTTTETLNNLLFGAALPIGMKGIAEGWIKAFGNVTPKDLIKLEKRLKDAQFEEASAGVKTPISSTVNVIADDFHFGDGTSLRDRFNSAKKYFADKKEATKGITGDEVVTTFASKGMTVTSSAGRLISDAINELNLKIKGEDVMGGGYGDIGADGKIIMAKQAIINNLNNSTVVNEESALKAIEDAKVANGVELEVNRKALTDEEQIEEILSNPTSQIENLPDAKDIKDVEKAITGSEKKATKEGLVGLRFRNDTGEMKVEELQEMADEVGVEINPNKLYKKQSILETKEQTIDKDYVNKIIDEIELKRTGYSSTKSTIISSFKAGVNGAIEKAKQIIGGTTGENYKPKYLKGEGVGRGKVDVNKLTLSELDEFNYGKGDLEIRGGDAKKVADKEIDNLMKTLNKEGRELAVRIRNATKQTDKLKVQKLIDANKKKLSELRSKNSYKNKIKTNFVKFVKNQIDNAGTQYTRSYFRKPSTQKQIENAKIREAMGKTSTPIRETPSYSTETILDKATINAIRNKYKALINSSTTVERANSLIKRMDEELHKKSFEKLEQDAGTLMKRVLAKAKAKGKKSNIDIDSVMKIADTYIKIQKAGGDLDKVRDLLVDLERFEREGKDLFKVNTQLQKASIVEVVKEGVDVLEREGKDSFLLRGRNSPTGGNKASNVVLKGIDLASEAVSALLTIPRLFGNATGLTKVFLHNFQKAETKWKNVRRQLVDIHGVNALKEANKIVKTNEGDASYKLTLWMRSKTEYGHDGNLMTHMAMRKNNKGDYEVLFVNDIAGHIKANKAGYDKGDYIYFGNQGNDELKERILNKIYKQFEDEMGMGTNFKKEIDWINSHFSQTGDEIIDIGKRQFDKIDFHKQEQYFPSYKSNKGGDESAIDSNGRYDTAMKESLQNGFLNKKVAPSSSLTQEMEMGFIENLSYHADTALWWKENVENLITADSTLRQMRKGLKGIAESTDELDINKENLFDTSLFGQPSKDDGIGNIFNPIMSKEVDNYLSSHLAKIATRGRSIAPYGSDRAFLNGLLRHANQIILGTVQVAAKQTIGYPVIVLHAGGTNFVSGMINSSGDNIAFAHRASGILMERQATYKSKEGVGNFHFVTQSDDWTRYFGMADRAYNAGLDQLIGNTTKLVDGSVSNRAWMSGMSKYLDEQGIVKSGSKYNLEEIAVKMGDEKWAEAVNYADNMMGRIMGSNTLVDKSMMSESFLVKTTMLFMRTGLHQMVSGFDMINDTANRIRLTNPHSAAILERVATGGKVFLGSIAVAIMNEVINEGFIQLKIKGGIKEEKEGGFAVREPITGRLIENPTLEDRVIDIARRYIGAVTVNPKLSPDLLVGIQPFVTKMKDAISAPTLDRKLEEASYAILAGFIPSSYGDLIRYNMSNFGIGGLPVENKVYDEAVKQVQKSVTNSTTAPGFREVVAGKTNDGKVLPTGDRLEKLVGTQIKINLESKKLADEKKPEQEAEKKFIEEGIRKYGKDITLPQVMKLYGNTPGAKDITKVSQLKSLQTKIQVASAKSEGEVNSLLQGKENEVIFNVVIKDMIDNGDIEGAKQKVLELRKKGVIKTNKGVVDMYKIFLNYRQSK